MNFNSGNENEGNNNYLSNFMYEFEDNLFTYDQPENHLPFASFSEIFDNSPEFNHALELETGFDQPGSSQNFPLAQPNWFPIIEDSDEMNIAGGSSTVLGEFDNSAALISHGMNKENAIKIVDDDSPSTGKKIMGQPLVTEGSSSGGRNRKGKGSPSKHLLAERKRREKVNQRILSLRSVVPKITKMDHASTLGDAICHIKDLSDKIDKLKLELESAPLPSPAIAPTSALEKVSQHPTRIEVRKREGGIVIHMCCSCTPGILHSIAKTLNNLGIDIQDAVFNCHDGFTLDLYRAQQINDMTEDQIKAILIETVRDQGAV